MPILTKRWLSTTKKFSRLTLKNTWLSTRCSDNNSWSRSKMQWVRTIVAKLATHKGKTMLSSYRVTWMASSHCSIRVPSRKYKTRCPCIQIKVRLLFTNKTIHKYFLKALKTEVIDLSAIRLKKRSFQMDKVSMRALAFSQMWPCWTVGLKNLMMLR